MKSLFKIIILVTTISAFTSCQKQGTSLSTDNDQAKKTEAMVAESNRRLGLPNITKFTEKRFMKLIYELRDKETRTYSYFMNRDGKLIFLCNSIGYGIPAAVQYVNPQKFVSVDSGGANYNEDKLIPQPEPNGMFMPDSLDATYVLCTMNGQVKPVYTEPKIIVSPFKLKAYASLAPTPKKKATGGIKSIIKEYQKRKASKPSTVN